MTEQLLKCPFCGGDALLEVVPPHKHIISSMPDYEGGAFIECAKCNCAMSGSTAEEITKAWNTRKPVEDVLERLEALTEKYMNNSEKAAELGKDYERHMILNGAKGMAFEEAIEILKEGLK